MYLTWARVPYLFVVPVNPVGESWQQKSRRGTDRLSDSLAARLASRKPALAPWLCVTAFRRVCSEQRAYLLTIVESVSL